MVDRELVLRKLSLLDEYADQLGEYRGLTAEQYGSDWKTQRIIERTLQLAIEACADIAHHVIADHRLRVPSTYAETFDVLAEAGLLDPALHGVMVRMARFRNLLVHDYARPDADLVVRIVREHVDDLRRFRNTVLEWLS